MAKSAGQIVQEAATVLVGIAGAMALILEARRGINPAQLKDWSTRLRRAADVLDTIDLTLRKDRK